MLKGQSTNFVLRNLTACFMTFIPKQVTKDCIYVTLMAEAPTLNVAKSAYKTIVGRPKKYEDSWRAMDRVCILETTLENLRQVKMVFRVLYTSLVCPGSALHSFFLFMPAP